jgi:hypothetical protein
MRVVLNGAVDKTPSHRPLANIYRTNGEEIGKKLLEEASHAHGTRSNGTTGATGATDCQIEPSALERASFRPILQAEEKVRAVMIRSQISDMQSVLNDEEVALCQRVYDHVRSVRLTTTDGDLDELARRIIHSFQHGVKDEDALTRLVI